MSNQISTEPLNVRMRDGVLKTTSLDIANHVEIQHKNIMQTIRNLDCPEEFSRLNFQPRDYVDSRGKTYPMYEIPRDGLVFLMGKLPGEKAARFMIAYINEFNRMELFLTRKLNYKLQSLAQANARTEWMLNRDIKRLTDKLLGRQDQIIDMQSQKDIRGTHMSREEKREMRRLFSSGLTYTEVGRKTGRSRDSVRRAVREGSTSRIHNAIHVPN